MLFCFKDCSFLFMYLLYWPKMFLSCSYLNQFLSMSTCNRKKFFDFIKTWAELPQIALGKNAPMCCRIHSLLSLWIYLQLFNNSGFGTGHCHKLQTWVPCQAKYNSKVSRTPQASASEGLGNAFMRQIYDPLWCNC